LVALGAVIRLLLEVSVQRQDVLPVDDVEQVWASGPDLFSTLIDGVPIPFGSVIGVNQ
jgi:hypothetical protein